MSYIKLQELSDEELSEESKRLAVLADALKVRAANARYDYEEIESLLNATFLEGSRRARVIKEQEERRLFKLRNWKQAVTYPKRSYDYE